MDFAFELYHSKIKADFSLIQRFRIHAQNIPDQQKSKYGNSIGKTEGKN